MACNTNLNGIPKTCTTISGGVTELYIAPKEDYTSSTIVDGEITALSLTASAPAEYYFRQGQASISVGSSIDFDASTTVFNNGVTVNLKGMDLAKRNELMALVKGQQELIVIARLDTGILFTFGLTEGDDGKKIGARVSEITGESGSNRSDTNQFVLTISQEQDKELPLIMDETAFDNLFL